MSAQDMVSQDPVDVAVPHYDEDAEELFSGPGYPGYYEDELENEEYYEGDGDEGYSESMPLSLELSPAQRGGSDEPSHGGTASGYTHSRGPLLPVRSGPFGAAASPPPSSKRSLRLRALRSTWRYYFIS